MFGDGFSDIADVVSLLVAGVCAILVLSPIAAILGAVHGEERRRLAGLCGGWLAGMLSGGIAGGVLLNKGFFWGALLAPLVGCIFAYYTARSIAG